MESSFPVIYHMFQAGLPKKNTLKPEEGTSTKTRCCLEPPVIWFNSETLNCCNSNDLGTSWNLEPPSPNFMASAQWHSAHPYTGDRIRSCQNIWLNHGPVHEVYPTFEMGSFLHPKYWVPHSKKHLASTNTELFFMMAQDPPHTCCWLPVCPVRPGPIRTFWRPGITIRRGSAPVWRACFSDVLSVLVTNGPAGEGVLHQCSGCPSQLM